MVIHHGFSIRQKIHQTKNKSIRSCHDFGVKNFCFTPPKNYPAVSRISLRLFVSAPFFCAFRKAKRVKISPLTLGKGHGQRIASSGLMEPLMIHLWPPESHDGWQPVDPLLKMKSMQYIILYMDIYASWWFQFNLFEKYARQIGSFPPRFGVKKNIYLSCHHLVMVGRRSLLPLIWE